MQILLVGATNNSNKFWNKILKNLISKGYIVFPINPKEEKIEWINCFKNISDIKNNFDLVIFVVKPEITLKLLDKNRKLLKNKKIWFQPWASDEKVKKYLEQNNFKDHIVDSCVMIENINFKNKS